MLSKSAARTFFLVGTGLCFGVFGLLTLDTLKRIPKQTNEELMTDQVVQGKHLWDRNNCMGCHTLLGEGAYYAPELTKVYERRGPEFIRAMLTDPEAMYPGRRKMVKYNFTEAEKEALISFFDWIGKIDLNGFPKKPDLLPTAIGNEVAAIGTRPKVFNQMCLACHSFQGQGGNVGPNLDSVGSRMTKDEIEGWLLDPLKVRPNSKMPKLPLKDSEIIELAAFLSQAKEGSK